METEIELQLKEFNKKLLERVKSFLIAEFKTKEPEYSLKNFLSYTLAGEEWEDELEY